MAESRNIRVTIRHHSEETVGGAVSDPLSDVHRLGCANGSACFDHPRRGQAARATYYCRVEKAATKTEAASIRAFHLCGYCVQPFARRYGIELDAETGGTR